MATPFTPYTIVHHRPRHTSQLWGWHHVASACAQQLSNCSELVVLWWHCARTNNHRRGSLLGDLLCIGTSELGILNCSNIGLLWFGRTSCWCSSHNHPYFSKGWTNWFLYSTFWWSSLVFVLSSNENFQLPFLDENFNLLLQIIALISVMSMVLVKSVILALHPFARISFKLF